MAHVYGVVRESLDGWVDGELVALTEGQVGVERGSVGGASVGV